MKAHYGEVVYTKTCITGIYSKFGDFHLLSKSFCLVRFANVTSFK